MHLHTGWHDIQCHGSVWSEHRKKALELAQGVEQADTGMGRYLREQVDHTRRGNAYS